MNGNGTNGNHKAEELLGKDMKQSKSDDNLVDGDFSNEGGGGRDLRSKKSWDVDDGVQGETVEERETRVENSRRTAKTHYADEEDDDELAEFRQ